MGKLNKVLYRNSEYLLNGKGLGAVDKIKLKTAPRYTNCKVSFFGNQFELSDAASFVSTYEEIFIKGIYEFNTSTQKPLIIDCGANVGLSVVFFKKLFPNAVLIAFEPDKNIFSLLESNVKNQGLSNVELRQEAVWTEDSELEFQSQGGLSGRLTQGERSNTIKVKSSRLKNILNQKVDFLKIDIEGAEYEVLKDCRNELKNVEKLFVEYHSSVDSEQKLDEILLILKEAGFRYHIQEAYTSPKPFVKIEKMMDMDLQLNIFAYRN